MTEWKPMRTAPRDGRRILLKYWPGGWHPRRGWHRYPHTKVEECIFRPGNPKTYRDTDCWEPWTGSTSVMTTARISEQDCIGWMEVPQ